jgi:hypothetical protein
MQQSDAVPIYMKSKLLVPQHLLIGFPYQGDYASFTITDTYETTSIFELQKGDILVVCCSTDPYVRKSLYDEMHKTKTASTKENKNIFSLEAKIIVTTDFQRCVNKAYTLHQKSQEIKQVLVPQYQISECKESEDSFLTILARLATYTLAFQKIYADQQIELQNYLERENLSVTELRTYSPQSLNHLLEMAVQLEYYEQRQLIKEAQTTIQTKRHHATDSLEGILQEKL